MKSLIKRILTQAGIEPVAWRQHVEITSGDGKEVHGFAYYDIQIMQGDDPLFTESQMFQLAELVAREWAREKVLEAEVISKGTRWI